ncbi:permease [Chromatiales bacterium (ex Bugula neritina AB1)]|nr:permease [Chromatiales bacterium (ex Bugula neritina AB1)]
MTDTTSTVGQPVSLLRRVDKAWGVFALILLATALIVPRSLPTILHSTLGNLVHTGVYVLFAVLSLAWLRATGAEAIVGRAFQGREYRMIILASLVGALAPFCSCEVIPFIAALLAMGTPLSAAMAFWLSSPIMDPPMFLITTSALGVEFALAKTLAAVGFGLAGGFTVKLLVQSRLLENPLRKSNPATCSSCCGDTSPFDGKPHWKFWQEQNRLETFKSTALENALFLFKWLALAYLIEALMILYVPAEWIAAALGGDGLQPIALGTLLGGPAYLNGYAAVPLVAGLLDHGMSQGAAMAFMLAGSVSCIPAAIAVWALVVPRVFVVYAVLGLGGSFLAGLVWNLLHPALQV